MSTTARALNFGGITVALLLWAAPAAAVDPIYTGLFNSNAVSGYDTVAYHTERKPVKGSKRYQTEYMGAVWRFSSQEHLDAFTAEPEKYAPQYGGYCAYAMAQGETASSDPEAWSMVDGKLYLNYSKKVRTRWLQDTAGYIKAADAKWPKLRDS